MSKQKLASNLERGKRMFEADSTVERITDDLYEVPSESRVGKIHQVIPSLKVCTCENFQRYGEPCKHFYLVQFVRAAAIKTMLAENQVKALSKIAPTGIVGEEKKKYKIGVIQ